MSEKGVGFWEDYFVSNYIRSKRFMQKYLYEDFVGRSIISYQISQQ